MGEPPFGLSSHTVITRATAVIRVADLCCRCCHPSLRGSCTGRSLRGHNMSHHYCRWPSRTGCHLDRGSKTTHRDMQLYILTIYSHFFQIHLHMVTYLSDKSFLSSCPHSYSRSHWADRHTGLHSDRGSCCIRSHLQVKRWIFLIMLYSFLVSFLLNRLCTTNLEWHNILLNKKTIIPAYLSVAFPLKINISNSVICKCAHVHSSRLLSNCHHSAGEIFSPPAFILYCLVWILRQLIIV